RWSVFFLQAEDGIRDWSVTGVQTCALPISISPGTEASGSPLPSTEHSTSRPPENASAITSESCSNALSSAAGMPDSDHTLAIPKIGRASCRERGERWVVSVALERETARVQW